MSKHHGRFRKNLRSQHSFLVAFENWKEVLVTAGTCDVLLVDLSKTFDYYIIHDLLLKNVVTCRYM